MNHGPKIVSVHFGKVRDSAQLSDGTRIVRTSDRISAFDMMMPFTVPGKGACLQEVSLQAFKETADVVPNHVLGVLDENTLLVRHVHIFPIECVMRRFLTGSLWRLYRLQGPSGVLERYGIHLPEGLTEHARLEEPVFTPTTKAQEGHDLPMRVHDVEAALADFLRQRPTLPVSSAAELAHRLIRTLGQLFAAGEASAQKRGLILVDTKYELGLADDGTLVLADEVHTPDSSRFWTKAPSSCGDGEVHQLSKEFLREELMSADIIEDDSLTEHGSERLEARAPELARRTAERYQELRQLFVGASSFPQNGLSWPVPESDFSSCIEPAEKVKHLLVVGSGGRDFSILNRFGTLPGLRKLAIHPSRRDWQVRQVRAQTLSGVSMDALAHEAGRSAVDLAIVGPELPIALGIKDAFKTAGIPCLAPGPIGAALEASKVLCKRALLEAGLPTAEARIVSLTDLKPLTEPPFLPCVLKYDGLAAGKGVFVVRTREQWQTAREEAMQLAPIWFREMIQLKAPTASVAAGEPLFLIEECLPGEEYSVMALCNGTEFRFLPLARDYKRRDDGQLGPNTGGMGSVAPVGVDEALQSQFRCCFEKLLAHQARAGEPYQGFMFLGFMVGPNGQAQVLEVNCRLGDPESQVILPGLSDEFLLESYRTAHGLSFFWPERTGTHLHHDGVYRVFVVAAAPEYPYGSAPHRMVRRISESGWATRGAGCQLVPSSVEPDGRCQGGRAFGVLAQGRTIAEARSRAYAEMASYRLDAEKPHYRTDIAQEWGV
jgi:phosphoribosylaminoimidazole-succinocarboxamide synthase